MPGLCSSNELISRDEGLHMDFACLLYSMLKFKLTFETVRQIIEEAVVIEKNFICDSLPCALIGMNATEMSQYIEFCADRLFVCLGYPKIYNATNPFGFIEMISLQSKANFFEHRPSSYQKAGVMSGQIKKQINGTDVEQDAHSFTTEESF